MAKRPVLYFDFDGTLHESMVIYETAFRTAYRWLIDNGHTREREVTSEEIAGWLGLSKMEMWSTFMPDLPEEITAKAGSLIGNTMTGLTKTGHAKLFPGTELTLDTLAQQGFTMVLVSNCSVPYMEVMRNAFNLDQWFSGYYVAEAYDWQPKDRFLKTAMDTHGRPAVMIGDRHKDIIAGKKNNAVTIGCSYGYGTETELDDADYMIDAISDLSKPSFWQKIV